jgi:hypothetical protein
MEADETRRERRSATCSASTPPLSPLYRLKSSVTDPLEHASSPSLAAVPILPVRRPQLEANSPKVPQPPHRRPLRLLHQQLIIRRLHGQLQVLLIPLPPQVGLRGEVMLDVAGQVRGFILRGRGGVVGRGDAEEEEGAQS